ncbi:MAG: DUF3124 domain-containing protein [bacterium]|nr:DUF3124 domain-containing protein [bacterium]
MSGSKVRVAISRICGALLVLGLGPGAGLAAEPVVRSKGQTVYVAAYSYVVMGSGTYKFPVSSTLVIRNTDPLHAIVVTAVDYRDSRGKHLRHHVKEPIAVGPLASMDFALWEPDTTGGQSPSFIVRWKANETVNAPVLETLMIGGQAGRAISFVGRAWVIEEAGDPDDEGAAAGR